MAKGNVFIVSGPSGVGKGTMVDMVNRKRGDVFLSVSCTTRAPRDGEVDGVNYHYITKEEFKKRIDEDYFIEWEKYLDNYYGTPKGPVIKAMEEGKHTILEIEVGGALKAKKHFPDAILVFVLPPNYDELKNRLIKRDEKDALAISAMEKRLNRALEEVEFIKEYDYVIINDSLTDAVASLDKILDTEFLKVKNNEKAIKSFLGKR